MKEITSTDEIIETIQRQAHKRFEEDKILPEADSSVAQSIPKSNQPSVPSFEQHDK